MLVALYDTLDPLIRPLALDEMGMSGRPECITKIMDLMQDDSTPGFTRIKAIEAAGRLRASAASPVLLKILEAKQVWRWTYHTELRISALQALQKIEPTMGMEKTASSGLDRRELVLEPTDPGPPATYHAGADFQTFGDHGRFIDLHRIRTTARGNLDCSQLGASVGPTFSAMPKIFSHFPRIPLEVFYSL